MPINNKPMNLLKSYTEYVITTPTTDFQIGFEFNEGINNLNILLDDAELPEGYDATIINTGTLRIEPAIDAGVLRLERETDIDTNLHNFTSGALFEAAEVDANFEQIRHSQQEANDQYAHLEGRVLPLVDGLEEALKVAAEASEAAKEASESAQEAAAQTKFYLRYYEDGVKYPKYARIMLSTGETVYSTVDDNVSDPNVDMSTWLPIGNISIVKTMTNLINSKFKVGDLVRTIGYYDVNDAGGGLYFIAGTSYGYGIPLANGTFALLHDSFDIRKFGIRNNIALDQTIELDRMVAFADTRIYEIDFLGYSIMTPKTTRWTNGAGSVVKGLMFKKVHKLKNLYIANDKTTTLRQGTNCLLFAPDDLNGTGLFKLENVNIDPYVADYSITSGDMDGFLCGFVCEFHPDSGAKYPDTDATRSKFDLELYNVKFNSAALSYNISCTNVFFNSVTVDGISGDYLGAFLVAHTYKLDVNKAKGTYRDDLHASNRSLVTNLIHHEPEVGNLPITVHSYDIRNSSSVKYSTGAQHVVFKVERKSSQLTFDSINIDRCLGSVEFYGGTISDEVIKRKFQVNTFNYTNPRGVVSLRVPIYIKSCVLSAPVFITDNNITAGLLDYIVADTVSVVGRINLPRYLTFSNSRIGTLYMSDVTVVDKNYGLTSSSTVFFDNIIMDKLTVNSSHCINAMFKSIEINELIVNTTVHNSMIQCLYTAGDFTPSVTIKRFMQLSEVAGALVLFDANLFGVVTFVDSNLKQVDNTGNCTVQYVGTTALANKPATVNPIGPKGAQTLDFPFKGITVNDNVSVNFTPWDNRVMVHAGVSSNGTVRVVFYNTSDVVVTLPSLRALIKLY